MPPEEPPTALRAPSERSRWPPEATKTPRETSCGLLLCNLDGKMQRQMGAKTSGNFWHIILGHGHCGGVGAQRIEIIIITILLTSIIRMLMIVMITIIMVIIIIMT